MRNIVQQWAEAKGELAIELTRLWAAIDDSFRAIRSECGQWVSRDAIAQEIARSHGLSLVASASSLGLVAGDCHWWPRHGGHLHGPLSQAKEIAARLATISDLEIRQVAELVLARKSAA